MLIYFVENLWGVRFLGLCVVKFVFFHFFSYMFYSKNWIEIFTVKGSYCKVVIFFSCGGSGFIAGK